MSGCFCSEVVPLKIGNLSIGLGGVPSAKDVPGSASRHLGPELNNVRTISVGWRI